MRGPGELLALSLCLVSAAGASTSQTYYYKYYKYILLLDRQLISKTAVQYKSINAIIPAVSLSSQRACAKQACQVVNVLLSGHLWWQVAEEDLKRVAAATGGVVQSTVNNLDPKVLGTCARFEEVQVSPPYDSPCRLTTMTWQGLPFVSCVRPGRW